MAPLGMLSIAAGGALDRSGVVGWHGLPPLNRHAERAARMAMSEEGERRYRARPKAVCYVGRQAMHSWANQCPPTHVWIPPVTQCRPLHHSCMPPCSHPSPVAAQTWVMVMYTSRDID